MTEWLWKIHATNTACVIVQLLLRNPSQGHAGISAVRLLQRRLREPNTEISTAWLNAVLTRAAQKLSVERETWRMSRDVTRGLTAAQPGLLSVLTVWRLIVSILPLVEATSVSLNIILYGFPIATTLTRRWDLSTQNSVDRRKFHVWRFVKHSKQQRLGLTLSVNVGMKTVSVSTWKANIVGVTIVGLISANCAVLT
jgi:hypothetical protein